MGENYFESAFAVACLTAFVPKGNSDDVFKKFLNTTVVTFRVRNVHFLFSHLKYFSTQ